MRDPAADEEARQKKAAENPLVSYFSGQQTSAKPPAPTAQASAPAAPPANQAAAAPRATNVGAASPAPAPATNGAQPPAPQRQQPTNFTNFERYFNANKDASARTADALAGRTALQAGQAQKKLEDQQAAFQQQVTAGTVGAYDAGTHQTMADPNGIQPGTILDTPNTQMSTDELTAQGQRAYTGPGGLGDVPGSEGVYDSALAAQQGLDALGTEGGIQAQLQNQNQQEGAGAARLSAGLVGAAGRKDFDALAARFNPQADVKNAVKASSDAAAAASALSAKNAEEWARQAGIQGSAEANAQALAQQRAKAASDASSAAAQQALNTLPPAGQEANVMAGIENNPEAMKQRAAELDAFNAATKTNAGDSARDFVNAISPSQMVAEATGNRNPLGDYMTGTYHPQGGSASGSTHGDHIPWGESTRSPTEAFWVFRQMNPAQWNELNSLPHNGQKEWIMKRLQQIRAKQDGKPIPGGNNWPKSGGA